MGGERTFPPSIRSQNKIKKCPLELILSAAESTSEVYSGSHCCFGAQLAFGLADVANLSTDFLFN